MQTIIEIFNFFPAIFFIAVGILSLIIGSFLNVVIFRLPASLQKSWRKQCFEFLEMKIPATDPAATKPTDSPVKILTVRSHCLHCHTTIRAYDNIPLLSYLLLRGKCRHCKKHISAQYPIIEGLAAILGIAVAMRFGVTWQTVAGCLLTYVLLVQSAIDYKHTIIPDEITLPMIWLGLLFSIQGIFVDTNAAIIGAVAGYLFLWIIYWVFYWVTNKEGMGFGDFKLLAMLGAWFGWQMLPFIVLFSSVIGSVCGIALIICKHSKRDKQIPFGPFLAISGWIAMMAGSAINDWYHKLFGIYV